jgi:hypothetical protein
MRTIVSARIGAILSLALAAFAFKSSAQTTLVSTGAVWRYMDNGSDQGTAWRANGFNDSGWASGPAELGFGDQDEATVNTAGFITYYYRHTFNVPNASSFTNLRAMLKRDDGAVIYLNGNELFRSNMPTGQVTAATLAATTAADDGKQFFATSLSPSGLISGDNVLAVEVHQSATTSSDVSFDFSLTGNPLPEVSIASPTNDQVIAATSVGISGVAIPGGLSVNLVEVFAGSTKIGESTNGTFNVVWTSVVPSNYVLTAVLTDSSGMKATSAPVNITVQAPPASMLIARGSAWKYNNSGVDLGTAWVATNYDDSTWGGPAIAPIGDNDEGGVQECVSVINIGPSGTRYPVLYYRRAFTVSSAASYSQLFLRIQADDSAAVYLNGSLLQSDGVLNPGVFAYEAGQTRAGADEIAYREFVVPATLLVNGTNVVAVENHQVNNTSSDLQFDLELEGDLDVTPPIASYTPTPGNTVLELSFLTVSFSENVTGVDASDLMINGEVATNMVVNDPTTFTFYFPQPSTGVVTVAWAPNHGIQDARANAFAGGSWNYNLDPNAGNANFVISEFLADNNTGIKDEDGQRNDWVELRNLGPVDGNLDGWFLTDSPTNLTQWRIPAVSLGNGNYVIIWCSGKDRTNLNSQLHTNFKLQKDAGGYLALVDRQTNIVSEFTNYPAQSSDISYGRDTVDPDFVGYMNPPSPGAQNVQSGSGFMSEPVISMPTGLYTNASITVTITHTNGAGTLRYTTDASTPTASSPVYSAPLSLSANSTIKARVFPPNGSALLPSAVVARNYIFLDATSSGFSSKLPTMIISTEGRGIPANVPPGQPRAKGSILIMDTQNGRSSFTTKKDLQELAAFEIFGQTSAGFPKLPIRIEIEDALGNDHDTSVLGMPADSDWRLRNPYNDKTEMNDYLGFTLWEDMGHYSVRRKFVEVFLDTGGGRVTYPGDYYGVMVLCETIKVNKDRVDIPKITPYNTNLTVKDGGFIIKRDKDSTGDLNFTTPGGSGFAGIPMKLHEPKPNDMRSAAYQSVTTAFPGNYYTAAGSNQLTYLRNFLGTMEQMLYAADWTTRTGTNHYSYYLDPVLFADQMLHVEMTKQIDGYRLSDYFTKGKDGRIGPGPVWDWNLSLGNANYAQGGMTNTWYYEVTGEQDHPWARRLIAGTSGATGNSGDPEFTQLVANRWAMFRTNVLNGTNLVRRIDEIATLLQESASRDLYGKWRAGLIGVYTWPNPDGTLEGHDADYVHPTNYFGPIEQVTPAQPTNSIVGQMKKWVLGRYLWIDSQFVTQPTISASGGMVTNGTSVTITPAPGTTLYYTTDGTDPRLFGGGISPSASTSTEPVTLAVNANIGIVARAKRAGSWKNTWSGPVSASFSTTTPSLRITEVMYHPAPAPLGSTNSDSDFEYIEVKNIGAVPLNVAGYSIAGGVQFQFPSVTMAAGQRAVIVANAAAYISRYGSNAWILGAFTGNLANDSDRVALLGGVKETIVDFTYHDSWYPTTDGFGFSLETLDENAAVGAWNSPGNWRPSSSINGSPGQTDPAPPSRPTVVISEIRANGDPLAGDIIELQNLSPSNANVAGWFLTDDLNTPKKYVIPSGTIPPFGFMVFQSTNSFGLGVNGFALGAKGDEVYVFSGNGVNLTGYAHGFDFGASASNTTIGRYVVSSGEDKFVIQSANTIGSANSGPLVGPIIINEIYYHPPDATVNGVAVNNLDDEYIELHNTSGAAVPLYDTAFPTNTWKLNDAVDYTFPQGVSIPANGYLLVVGFDPSDATALADFRSRNGVPGGVPVYGPWNGSLDNNTARVELERPDVPDTNGVAYILVERVQYSDTAPWPSAADGFGYSLQRIVGTTYGNDPTNWASGFPTPGGNYVPAGGSAPTITSQPGNRGAIFGSQVTLNAAANGTGPLHYQWRFFDVNIPGATNSTFVIPNFSYSLIGPYNLVVYNAAGYAQGTNFSIIGREQLQITLQPVDRIARVGNTTNFTVAAIGTGTIGYQWKFNGTDIPGATSSTLTVANIQATNEGTYTVAVSDDFDTFLSQPATLTVISAPVLTLKPFNETAVEGTSVSFSTAAGGTTPINFRWRTNFALGGFANISNVVFIHSPSNSTIVITNVPLAFNGMRVQCLVTNIAGQTQTTNATLTVLADTDHDGLPDIFEQGRPGFSTTDPSDAARDDDGDGMSNAAEYFAGTDPFDPQSYLKATLSATGPAIISLNAVSNRSYSVYFTDAVPGGWQKLGDVLSRANTREEVLLDTNNAAKHFYRLVTPAQP